MSDEKIKKSTVVFRGKKVPLYKIPTGMSGMTPDTKKAVEFNERLNDVTEDKAKGVPVEEIEDYYNSGDVTSSEVTDYINSRSNFEEADVLFDKVEE